MTQKHTLTQQVTRTELAKRLGISRQGTYKWHTDGITLYGINALSNVLGKKAVSEIVETR
jgi:hypothetical protein